MGLEAWQQRPAEGDAWLEKSFAWIRRRQPTPLDLAQLILAADRRTLERLGVGALEGSAT